MISIDRKDYLDKTYIQYLILVRQWGIPVTPINFHKSPFEDEVNSERLFSAMFELQTL
jgi:hypothetical protein